jgi:hypothetical protein
MLTVHHDMQKKGLRLAIVSLNWIVRPIGLSLPNQLLSVVG